MHGVVELRKQQEGARVRGSWNKESEEGHGAGFLAQMLAA